MRALVVLLILVFFSSDLFAAIAIVNQTDLSNGPFFNASPISLTPVTVSAGNLLVLDLAASASVGHPTTVTDDKGDSWVEVPNTFCTQSPQTTDLWYAPNAVGGSTTITVTFTTASGNNAEIHLSEISGADTSAPLVSGSGATLSTTASPTTVSLTADASGEILYTMTAGNALALTGVLTANWVGFATNTKTPSITATYINPPLSAQHSDLSPITSQAFCSSGAVFTPTAAPPPPPSVSSGTVMMMFQ